MELTFPQGLKAAAEKTQNFDVIGYKRLSGAEARIDSVGLMRGLKPPPPSGASFSSAPVSIPALFLVSSRTRAGKPVTGQSSVTPATEPFEPAG